jgi:cell division protein FtsB
MQSIMDHKITAREKSGQKNMNQMSAKITELEQKVYQLESEKQALESCLNKMQDDLVNAKDNEEDIRN